MKILTFTSLFPSQIRPDFAIFVFQRTSYLAKRPEIHIQVVAPVPYFPSGIASERWGLYGQFPRQERFAELDVHHPRYPLLPGLLMPLHGVLMFLGCLFLVRRLHRRFHFDCIDSHYVYPDGFAAVLLGKVLGLPVLISARGTDVNLFTNFRTIRPMILWALRRASGIVAVSAALKDKMAKLGLPASAIRVIPNGVDAKRFHLLPRNEARSKLSLEESAKIAVSVGSLTEGKNHIGLISAFAVAAQGHPEYRLYIIGQGHMKGRLERLIQDLGLRGQVFLVGPKPNDQIPLWFNAANVSCLVSTREGWPNVLMESIACGTPVVASRVGGIPEIVTSLELGVLVDPSPEDIAVGIERAFAREWDRATLVRHAQARDWDQVAAEVEEYIRSRLS